MGKRKGMMWLHYMEKFMNSSFQLPGDYTASMCGLSSDYGEIIGSIHLWISLQFPPASELIYRWCVWLLISPISIRFGCVFLYNLINEVCSDVQAETFLNFLTSEPRFFDVFSFFFFWIFTSLMVIFGHKKMSLSLMSIILYK